MNEEFWINKWKSNEIGFHQKEYNPNLTKFWKELIREEEGAVFIPLCGKSLDMMFFLESGHKIYGAELSQMAVEAFFNENKLGYSSNGDCYFNERASLYCSDIFKLEKKDFENVKFIYDRAALVALPPEVRVLYVKWLRETFPKASIFLESLEFDNSEVGPPFSITRDMIDEYYGEFYQVEEKQFLDMNLEEVRFHSGKISKIGTRINFLRAK